MVDAEVFRRAAAGAGTPVVIKDRLTLLHVLLLPALRVFGVRCDIPAHRLTPDLADMRRIGFPALMLVLAFASLAAAAVP